MNLKVGQKAPEFELPDQDGKTHRLADYLGKWVLLYFYPKDDTSGCTAEACALRDNMPDFGKINAVVLGVSADSVESHKSFAQKNNLPFTLLADQNKTVIGAYDVWREKTFEDKKFMGIVRTSFLINPAGEIVKIYENVTPETHALEVLADLNKLSK